MPEHYTRHETNPKLVQALMNFIDGHMDKPRPQFTIEGAMKAAFRQFRLEGVESKPYWAEVKRILGQRKKELMRGAIENERRQPPDALGLEVDEATE